MAPHDEEDDPAVYRSGSHKKDSKVNNGSKQMPNGTQNNEPSNGASDSQMDDIENGGEHEEDGMLLTVQPGYNRLLLVLRDEGVMRFVKYVSAAAESSRWDVCGEYEIGMVQEDGDE
jgi:prolyl 3-hydroxylase /prolyl 3,4-dihydroxylase